MSEGTCRKMFKEDKDGDTAPAAIKHDRELHARIRELEGARKWAFAYLNHIQQTEPDRSVWAMEPTPKWSFILELAKAAGARWSGHDWESDEAALARSEVGKP